MKKSHSILESLRLRIHWYYIARYRAQAIALLDSGVGCCDPRLVTLSNKILTHGMAVSLLWGRQKGITLYELEEEDTLNV